MKNYIATVVLSATISLNAAEYVGRDGQVGGSMGILNMSPEITHPQLNSVIEDYNSVTNTNLLMYHSTLRLSDQGQPLADDEYGYDGNIAIISNNYTPATFDAFAQTYNTYGEPCQIIDDLTMGPNGVRSSFKCTQSHTSGIAYGIIWINTNSPLMKYGGTRYREYILRHELLHMLGFRHNGHRCTPMTSQESNDYPNVDPMKCGIAPLKLQPSDKSKLVKYYRM